MKGILVSMALVLSLVLGARSAAAAELSGTVYSKGSPVANLTVAVKESDLKTKTGPKGEYHLELAPGTYTLVVRGKEFSVTVAGAKTRHDIQL